ncbi:DNA glycosylase AlkZ-like family protein [Pseudomonas protegens]|uniref:DNA glycosylase AlkZ-like family protein n=1 Tax=Pseudomonas protegens TaxID=380021 RepID=UPI00391C90F7
MLACEVQGWRQPAYCLPQVKVPRKVEASALLSPFDSLIWERSRTERLFDFRYRLEIYTPRHKRVFGRSCTTSGSSLGSICGRSELRGVWRCMGCMGCMKSSPVWTKRASGHWPCNCARWPIGWGWSRFSSIASVMLRDICMRCWSEALRGQARSYSGLAGAGLSATALLAFDLLQSLGNQEGQFQGLVGVHPWIAMGVIAIR